MESNKREMSFRLNTNGPRKYDIFLFRNEEEGLEIHFANVNEEEGNTVVTIENIVAIPKEKMIEFGADLFEALTEYESKFNNGFGIRPPKKKGK